ncbi:MAG: hypothetical protein ACRD50_14705 [Candidatus Acidiferrales bacterium]
MRFNFASRLFAGVAALALTLAALAPVVFAQGCVMCYTSASAANQNGQKALINGILTLMLPVLSLFIGMLTLLYRHRDPQPGCDADSSREDFGLDE